MSEGSESIRFETAPSDPVELAALIKRLYSNDVQALQHGEIFTGKPSTKIRCDDNYVLKFNQGHVFEERMATRWLTRLASRERQYGVAHPDKIWFALKRGDQYLVANLTPRLQPLHALLPQLPDNGARVEALEKVLQMVVVVPVVHGYGLDEGLSNFGVGPDGRLYYLDDDYYQWTGFTTLVQAIQLWFRSFSWLSGEHAARLGGFFRALIEKHFDDPHVARSMGESLRNEHIPDQSARDNFADFAKEVVRKMAPSGIRIEKRQSSRLAVLADIHSNLPALEAVLEDMKKLGVSEAVVLGDSIGYGPFPAECVALLAERGFKVIKGNHDHGIANKSFEKGFSQYASWAARWTYPQLSPEAIRWLEELPLYVEGPRWLAVHGAPCDRYFFYGYVYQMTYEKNLQVLKERDMPVCFHGHTHLPGVYYSRGEDSGFLELNGVHSLAEFDYCLVCPGSVGQPRNGNPNSQYLIFDTQQNTVEFRSIEYDLERTCAAMKQNGFPGQLIDRLRMGE